MDFAVRRRRSPADWSVLSLSMVSVVSPPSSEDDEEELEEDEDELDGSSSFFGSFLYHTVPSSSTYSSFPLLPFPFLLVFRVVE